MEFFKSLFGGDDGPRERDETDIRVATCALFLEIAGTDNEFSEEERQSILAIMRNEYGLSAEEAKSIAREAAGELKKSVDVWRFTNAVNEHYNEDEKLRVVELLWRVVYADGKLDAHEDYLIHKLGKLLRLQHKQLIAAKLRVMHDDEGG